MASQISTKFYSVIAGAGPGTGRAIAQTFSHHYPVILLSRTPAVAIAQEIQSAGGEAHTISTDVSDEASVKNAFEEIKKKMGEKNLACAVFNVGGRFMKKGFLETSVEEWKGNVDVHGKGLFLFSQSALPLLLQTTSLPSSSASPHPPTLLCTGATASLRGGSGFSALSGGCFAMRSVCQSIGSEFGPQGVHVAHLVVDGLIDTPATQGMTVNGGVEDSKVDTGGVAEIYWNLHTQGKGAWTQELDVRPWVEKF